MSRPAVTVACVWVRGNVPYPIDYVTKLAAMVRRHLDRPHTFACLTDQPWLVPAGLRAVPVPSVAPLAGWWAKVHLFDPSTFEGRVVYLDLDSLVVSRLDGIVDYPSEFALVPHAGTFVGAHGLRTVPKYNSSVMVFDAGVPAKLHTQWTPHVATRLWGDQDYIGEAYPNADTMPAEWFPRVSELAAAPPGPSVKVVLCKKPKNEEAAARWPWVARAWRAA